MGAACRVPDPGLEWNQEPSVSMKNLPEHFIYNERGQNNSTLYCLLSKLLVLGYGLSELVVALVKTGFGLVTRKWPFRAARPAACC